MFKENRIESNLSDDVITRELFLSIVLPKWTTYRRTQHSHQKSVASLFLPCQYAELVTCYRM